jgi:hypothetical protein
MLLKKVKLIAPNNYQEVLADLFSKEVYSTNKEQYDKRNQTNRSKVESDIYIGKMAEFAVWNFLIEQSKSATFPDIGVYPKELKSFDADITSGDVKIHVKSCMDVWEYPNSWVFQPNDSLCTSPSDKEFIAFVICSPDKKFEAYFVLASKVIELYRPPRKEGLDKKVIYEENLMILEV